MLAAHGTRGLLRQLRHPGLLGLRETVTIVSLGVQVAVGWILFSPVRTLRQPSPPVLAGCAPTS